MDWYSPLFRTASRAILDAAKAEFSRTMVGQLVAEVRRETSRAYRSPDRLRQALGRYSRHGAKDALRDLRGTQFGQFAGRSSVTHARTRSGSNCSRAF